MSVPMLPHGWKATGGSEHEVGWLGEKMILGSQSMEPHARWRVGKEGEAAANCRWSRCTAQVGGAGDSRGDVS